MGYQTRKKDGICKLIAELPEDKHQQFKSACAKSGMTMKEVILIFVNQYIKEQSK